MKRITESESHYHNLESKSIRELLVGINQEDITVPKAVSKAIPAIEKLVEKAVEQLNKGGRIFYIGAGTSGRLGVVDASECPPTFGVPHGLVVGIMAGGDQAMRKAVEFAEDNTSLGWADLQEHLVHSNDIVIGIAASGTTPYVIGALEECQKNKIPTGCITCNPNSPIILPSDFPIEVVVGPEFVTGSTRMKSGTAQKLVLNMISTACMIRMGRVKGNRMVDMQLSNNKLVDRGTQMVMQDTGVTYDEAKVLLLKHGSVRMAVENFKK
ncbi:MAG: N-acetylmuramic acid 6-phosphate etherase [Flavobacteriales bacterium]|nr:N-acetylmuramic acid 6-phosphate etherase [Flavobacteriales bacterium]